MYPPILTSFHPHLLPRVIYVLCLAPQNGLYNQFNFTTHLFYHLACYSTILGWTMVEVDDDIHRHVYYICMTCFRWHDSVSASGQWNIDTHVLDKQNVEDEDVVNDCMYWECICDRPEESVQADRQADRPVRFGHLSINEDEESNIMF